MALFKFIAAVPNSISATSLGDGVETPVQVSVPNDVVIAPEALETDFDEDGLAPDLRSTDLSLR